MLNWNSTFKKISTEMGYKLDEISQTIYGENNGYIWNLYYQKRRGVIYPLAKLCVSRSDGQLTKEEIKELKSRNKNILNCSIESNTLIFSISSGGITAKQMAKIYLEVMDSVGEFLKEKNFKNCCEECGSLEQTLPVIAAGERTCLCEQCYKKLKENFNIQAYTYDKKDESILSGMVGAFLGSIIGVFSIIAFSQMGYVSAISGLILAICTLKGYELFSKKFSVKGIVISSIIMLVMVYVGDCIDWGITISQFFDLDIFTSIRLIPELISEGLIDTDEYIRNLLLLYFFVLLGMIPTIKSISKSKKQRHIIYSMGEYMVTDA